MMISCAINGCPSDQTTKVDGKPISFFAFPEDDLRKNQWLHNCNLASGVLADKEPLYLCELHFEGVNFTASRDLKANAVPTLFGRIEEPLKTHATENISQTLSMKILPSKQKKLDEHSHTLVTPPQSPFAQLTDNVEDLDGGNTADMSVHNTVTINGSTGSNSIVHVKREPNARVYRLTIQIDKIRSKPGPRCKKLVPLIMLNSKYLAKSGHGIGEKTRPLLRPLVKKPCPIGSCKLRKCTFESKPAFQCELCSKFYIVKREEDQGKDNTCSICFMTLPNPQSLYVHFKNHFVCDMCQTECNSQIMYDKHVRLHVSTDAAYPYKCHQCTKTFELKEGIKQHCLTEHPKIRLFQIASPTITAKLSQQGDYRCTICNIIFKNDQAYRNHVSSHRKKDGFKSSISETNNIFPVPNPLTGSQIGILQPVKFSCNVCSKQFDNVREVDVHTRTHLGDVEEDHKCNICMRLFKNSATFSEHLKHHLSRAYPCPICSKAFINRTTLKIHLKTHES